MAYDPQLHAVIMFGGGTPSTPLNDTWAWDGKGWSDLHPATTPPAASASIVYDAAAPQLLLNTSNQTGSTIWTWKHGDWTLLRAYPARTCEKLAGGGLACSPPMATSPEGFGYAIYDAALGKLVTQDGLDIWAGDGLNWTKLGSLSDSLGTCFCMAYDSTARQLMTVANTGGKYSPAVGHTLVFEGTAWTMVPAATPAVTQAMLIDDPASSAVLMLSINEIPGAASSSPEEMWSWNGRSWTQIKVTLPPVMGGSSMVYDAAHQRVVLFGGMDAYGTPSSDTWTWDGRSWQKRI